MPVYFFKDNEQNCVKMAPSRPYFIFGKDYLFVKPYILFIFIVRLFCIVFKIRNFSKIIEIKLASNALTSISSIVVFEDT